MSRWNYTSADLPRLRRERQLAKADLDYADLDAGQVSLLRQRIGELDGVIADLTGGQS